MAQSGTPGPVFLELPLDVLYQEKTARDVYTSKKTAPASLFDRVANWYMTYHLDNIFSGAKEVTFHKPLDPRIVDPSSRYFVPMGVTHNC
jgi:acetolactate synthase-like protein